MLGLALFRILVGFMFIRHTWAFMKRYWWGTYFEDKWHIPYFDWLPMPGETLYVLLLIGMLSSAVFLMLGLWTRWALIAATSLGWYHLMLNMHWYRHNKYFILLSLFVLCFTPCHRALSWDAIRLNLKPVGDLWATYLLRLQMTFIYLASATSKTQDKDWHSGNVLVDRALIWAAQLKSEQADSWQIALANNELLWRILTWQALFQEFFLAICLWIPRMQRLAIWVGILFHGHIEAAYSVLVFSYMTVGTYFLLIKHPLRNRVLVFNPNNNSHLKLVSWVGHLDWLQRVRFESAEVKDWKICDPQNRWYDGAMGWAVLGSSLPLTYFVAFPLTALGWFHKGSAEPTEARQAFESQLFHQRLHPIWLVLVVAMFVVYTTATGISSTFYLPNFQSKWGDLPFFLLILYLIHRTFGQKVEGFEINEQTGK